MEGQLLENYFSLSLIGIISLIYGLILVISLFFTFSLDIYRKIEEKLQFVVYSSGISTPLDIRVDSLDKWLVAHNSFAGSVLALLSIIDWVLFTNIIGVLEM